jgi:uncharacterized protein (TIGR02300 family)
VARPELGTKRQCQTCGAKFYDMSKDPILCPKCGTVFQAVMLRAPVAAKAREADEEVEVETAAVELVSLDEVAAGEDAKEVVADDDIDIGDDIAADDDTFLEEEEEGEDDVADLIDGDIEDDEEV